MIAALPMYLRAANLEAHQAFWSAVRDGLRARDIAAPDALDVTTPEWDVWSAPDLVLSHICNLPYRAAFKGKLTLIGASDYGLEGCPPGHYRSHFVVHRDHPATAPEALDGATMAYNSPLSQSGWGAAVAWALGRDIAFRPTRETGSHAEALRAVARREVDFAAIDAATFEFLRADMAETAEVRVIGATDPSPGMTFVTRPGEDPSPYRAALLDALGALPLEHRNRLMLRDIVTLPESAYDLPIPASPADILGLKQG